MTPYFSARYQIDENGCWIWTGCIHKSGYGVAYIDGKEIKAHRLSYTLFHGNIREGMCVLHRCDVKPCVNPEHLWQGTSAENVADMDAKGRRGNIPSDQVHCGKLTWEKVREIRRIHSSGTMGCRKLAHKFGVSKTNILLILKHKIWREKTCQH